MVSNQDGLGTAAFPNERFEECQQHVLALFNSQGIDFEQVFICPHLAEDACDCRKPRTGLLTRFLAANAINLQKSAVIGDRPTDAELAQRIGVQSFTIDPVNPEASWLAAVSALCHADRRATARRTTKETDIRVAVNLDRTSPVRINTGIGFYDHMLEQVAKHAGFSLEIDCDGDLEIDDHHTVEDTALCLGSTIREALGNKLGIGRYGFVVPMDESEARVSIDLSGRSRFRFSGEFPRDQVGEMSTEMVEHSFQSLADSLGAALHVEVSGENTHHMVEACFKAIGRALGQAIRLEGKTLPSTKGTLE
jgi:imidazoleglycerol-phosphate dehydratase/histidinol-phosphatase